MANVATMMYTGANPSFSEGNTSWKSCVMT